MSKNLKVVAGKKFAKRVQKKINKNLEFSSVLYEKCTHFVYKVMWTHFVGMSQ